MKAKMILVVLCAAVAALAQQPQTAQEKLPRQVVVKEIPGVIAAGAKWEQVWQGIDNADGIVGTPDGGVIFAQEQPSTVRKLDKNGFDSALVKDTHGAGSVTMDAQGRIIAVQRTCTDPGRGDLPCTEPTKVSIVYPEKDRKVLADSAQGKPLGRVSDIVVDKKGTVYFTGSIAYYVKPGGQVVSIENVRANGVMLSPDEKTLYVTDGPVIAAFDIQADGTVIHRRDFAKLVGGNGDGLAVDAAGRLYVATQPFGIQVFGSDGKYLGSIPTPRDVASIGFSGPDKKALFMTGGGMLHPSGKELALVDGLRNNGKTIYKINMLAEGYKGRAK